MYECFPYDPDFKTCFVDKTRIEIAINQIAKLFEWKDETDWAGLDPVKWKELTLNAQELNMKAVRCDCRHCQPDLWEKDDRDIWINISP